MAEEYVIRSSRVVADGRVGPGGVWVRGEKIARVELAGAAASFAPSVADPRRSPTAPDSVMDVGDLVVMPGLVDTHVHVNEPGRTDWEGFVTVGRAAAAGGITTIVVMPLNCTPAATNVAALMGEAEAAAGKCLVDYGFWGGLVPGNVDELEPMWEAGALGFKCFMVESGVEDFGAVAEEDLRIAAPVLARLGAPLLVHAEDPEALRRARHESGLNDDPRSYQKYLASRPEEVETRAAMTVLKVVQKHPRPQLRAHIVHLACDRAARIATSGAEGVPLGVTGETCPHYLMFGAEDIPDGATQFKCAPPIREHTERELLWQCLLGGTFNMVVSDHSPCPPDLKCLDTGDFSKAWGGIASLQLGLPVTWTAARRATYGVPGIVGPLDIARWMSENPARLGGLHDRKGRIAPGFDADLVIFDPEVEWIVRGELLHHRHKLTPYDGMTLRGVVKRTILRGRTIYDAAASNPFPLEPIGQWIKRGST